MSRYTWSVTALRGVTTIKDCHGAILGSVSWNGSQWLAVALMGGESILWCGGSADRRAVTAALKARIASYEAESRIEQRALAHVA